MRRTRLAALLTLAPVVDGGDPPAPAPVRTVLESLTADDAAARAKAVTALGAHPDAAAAAPVLVDALDDDDATVREAAGKVLAALGRKGLADYSGFLADPKDPARVPLAELDGNVHKLGSALTAADLAYSIALSRAPFRRAGAAFSVFAVTLDAGGTERTFDILAATLRDRDAGVRSMAATALFLLGWGAASADHPATAEELAGMLRALEDKESDVRRPAACVIGLLRPRDPAFVQSLSAAAEDDAVWYPAHMALQRLGAEERLPYGAKAPSLDELVAKLGASKDEWTRRGSLDDMRRMGPAAEPAVPRLAELLAAESGWIRVEIARTLLVLSPDREAEVAKALAGVLRAGNRDAPGMWEPAVSLLAAMGPAAKPAIPELIDVLAWPEEAADPDADLADLLARNGAAFRSVLYAKRAAVVALGACGGDAGAAAPALTALQSNDDLRLRYRAAVALRRVRP